MRTPNHKLGVFPPIANPCPDGWTIIDSSTCQVNGNANIGTGTLTSYVADTEFNGIYSRVNNNENQLSFISGNASICNTKKWANKYHITWDGVTNYNGACS